MPGLIPIPILKAAIVDTVASGDLPLMALLQDNVDMIWSMNQRRSTAQPVQFLYCLSDALRMGMDYTRTSIDAALTDSEALAVKRARALSSRIYDASNSASGTMALTVDGEGRDDEVSAKLSDLTNTASEHSDHSLNGFTTGRDTSATSTGSGRDIGESVITTGRESTFGREQTDGQTAHYNIDLTQITPAQNYSLVHQLDINSSVFGLPVRFGYRDGYGQESYRNYHIASGQLNPGTLDFPGPWANYTTMQASNTVDDTVTQTGRGTLVNGLAELGSGGGNTVHNIHDSGGMTTIDNANRHSTHLASASLHSHADVSASQVSVTTAANVTSSNAVDTSHSEAHELGESSELLTGTIDYLGQLFTNLKTMYTNVCAQITAFESQISVGTRYVNNRMTTKVPPSPLPCNTSVTWLTNLSLNGNPTSWWGI